MRGVQPNEVRHRMPSEARRIRGWLFVVLSGCGALASGTGGDDAGTGGDGRAHDSTPALPGAFDPAITHVAFEIDYETGQAPYTGTIVGFGNAFDLTVANIDRLFS